MNGMRKYIFAIVLALFLGGIMSRAALAFDCNNPNINDKAVVGVVNLATGVFTPTKPNWGSIDEEGIRIHGAWVKLVFPWGASYNIFVHGILPDGAMDAGPGENLCDGKGIDDLDACLAIPAP